MILIKTKISLLVFAKCSNHVSLLWQFKSLLNGSDAGSIGHGGPTISGADFLCWVNVGWGLIPSKYLPDFNPKFLLLSLCQVHFVFNRVTRQKFWNDFPSQLFPLITFTQIQFSLPEYINNIHTSIALRKAKAGLGGKYERQFHSLRGLNSERSSFNFKIKWLIFQIHTHLLKTRQHHCHYWMESVFSLLEQNFISLKVFYSRWKRDEKIVVFLSDTEKYMYWQIFQIQLIQ